MANLISAAGPLFETDVLPEGFLETVAADLHRILPGPTLIHLAGKREEPLFVSILLHGNETTGLAAIQSVLRHFGDRSLPRSLSLFIGNVDAARAGMRGLDTQQDYNRAWPGTLRGDTEEAALMAAVTARMAGRRVFASIDIHNNTGLNPHYACINRLDWPFINLAALFGRLVIYFTHPKGTQTAAFAELCAAVTLECGKPDNPQGAAHAAEFVEACLHLPEIPDHAIHHEAIDLYHTVAQVTIPETVSFGFGNCGADLQLKADLDHLNFTDLAAGAVFGRVRTELQSFPVVACDEAGTNRARDYFELAKQELRLRRPLMPSMLTLDEGIIRQDCLCYVMERISHRLPWDEAGISAP